MGTEDITLTASPECRHCRERLCALERASVSHDARLGAHDEALAVIRVHLQNMEDSGGRAEKLLERILGIVTPSAQP